VHDDDDDDRHHDSQQQQFKQEKQETMSSSSSASSARRMFVSSSSASPVRPSVAAVTGLVGEGSPLSSPLCSERKGDASTSLFGAEEDAAGPL
jgi:hypothetical protein